MSKILEAQRAMAAANKAAAKMPTMPQGGQEQILESQGYIKVAVPVMSGTKASERIYYVMPLKRKEMFIIRHRMLAPLFDKLAGIAKMIADKGEKAATDSIMSLFGDINPELVWDAASMILKDAIVENETILDLDTTTFFDDKFEEIYIVVLFTLAANTPFFSKMNDVSGGVQRATKV